MDGYLDGITKDRDLNPLESAIALGVRGASSPITYLGDSPNRVMQYAAPVAGTAKYVIPAAGVTAAGAGLYDLAQQFSADQEYNNVQPL
jgi:hypothetical protein